MPAKRAKKKLYKKTGAGLKIETKMVGQIRFFEELHVIRDEYGETIFTGSPEAAKRILKLLNKERKGKRR